MQQDLVGMELIVNGYGIFQGHRRKGRIVFSKMIGGLNTLGVEFTFLGEDEKAERHVEHYSFITGKGSWQRSVMLGTWKEGTLTHDLVDTGWSIWADDLERIHEAYSRGYPDPGDEG